MIDTGLEVHSKQAHIIGLESGSSSGGDDPTDAIQDWIYLVGNHGNSIDRVRFAHFVQIQQVTKTLTAIVNFGQESTFLGNI